VPPFTSWCAAHATRPAPPAQGCSPSCLRATAARACSKPRKPLRLLGPGKNEQASPALRAAPIPAVAVRRPGDGK
jgi:hypothetical protein